jgi:WD40 repeat protein
LPVGGRSRTGSGDTAETGVIRLFDTSTRRSINDDLSVGSPVVSLAFQPKGSDLAVGTLQGDLWIFDAASSEAASHISLFNPGDWVLSLSFDPSGRRLVATSAAGHAVVIERLVGKPVVRRLPESDETTAAMFSPDGRLLVTGESGGTIRFRQGETLKPIGPKVPAMSGVVYDLAFGPDAHIVAAIDINLSLRFIDVRAREPIGDALAAGSFGRAVFLDAAHVVVPSADGTAIISLSANHWRNLACQLAGRGLSTRERHTYLNPEPRMTCPPASPSR